MIARLLENGPQVLATGGGAFMDEATRENISRHGTSIWLRADLDLLMKRVMKRSHRPLLKTKDPRAVMEKLMNERYPVYALADIIVDTRDAPHEVIVADVIDHLSTLEQNSQPHGAGQESIDGIDER